MRTNSSTKVFVLPFAGVNIVYDSEAHEIQSRMDPVPAASPPAPEPKSAERAPGKEG